MSLFIYSLVFIAAFLVDIVPLIGPPAWTVMVLFQLQFDLNIWLVIIVGVTGSAMGRWVYSAYIPFIANRFITPSKNSDLQFVGAQFGNKGWKVYLFVLLYTLMPLPSTPLFTAIGIARINALKILPSFFAGKFISDALMVQAGNYVSSNAIHITQGIFSWKSLLGTAAGLIILALFLFTDWKRLLLEKKFKLRFNIWK